MRTKIIIVIIVICYYLDMHRIYFISGVSGVGKTSTLRHLQNLLDNNLYNVRDLDERGVPDGGGEEWLINETRHWLDVAKENVQKGMNTIICGFANPELFEKIYNKDQDVNAQIILLHASEETIRERLMNRHNTPKSIEEIERASGITLNEFIESNSKFSKEFKEIFEKRNLHIVETDNKTPEEVTDEIIEIIKTT